MIFEFLTASTDACVIGGKLFEKAKSPDTSCSDIMDYVFYGPVPLPTTQETTYSTLCSHTNNEQQLHIRKIIFDVQGDTLEMHNRKKLLYKNGATVFNVLAEFNLLNRYKYTDVINMPGNIKCIANCAKFYGISVHDKRNLKRIYDLCSDNLMKKKVNEFNEKKS